MIKSMTGFGQITSHSDSLTIAVEVKSLNSKFLDLSLRLPRKFSDRELELRTWVGERLERGKISVSIEYQQTARPELALHYNEELFTEYYNELKRLADKVGAPVDPIFQLALASPDVAISNGKEEIDPADWDKLVTMIGETLDKCDAFRQAEGKALEVKLIDYIETIRQSLVAVEQIDPTRIEKIRSRIKGNVKDLFGGEGFEANRLEQEIIFYIEKLDIHEERVRLKTHLDYFIKALGDKQSSGKKLGFIAQEIGREINTIGSKANDAEMQQHVVMMKEELEKIKEQLSNVL